MVLLDRNGGDGINMPGNELVPFQPGNNDSETQINPFMSPPASLTMGVDVNAPFSGINILMLCYPCLVIKQLNI